MLNVIQIQTDYKPKTRHTTNALLALATGVLALIYPESLYLIAGGVSGGFRSIVFPIQIAHCHCSISNCNGSHHLHFPGSNPIYLRCISGDIRIDFPLFIRTYHFRNSDSDHFRAHFH